MSEAAPAEGTARTKPQSPPEGPVITIQQQAAGDRRRRYAAEMAVHERASMRELEELFDRRRDGVAAARQFTGKLRFHVVMFGDGTHGTSAARILGDLTRAERRLQRARGDAG